jgi:hypothetical protein
VEGKEGSAAQSRVSSEHRYSLKYAEGFWTAVLEGVVSSVIRGFISHSSETHRGVSRGTPTRILEDIPRPEEEVLRH